MRAALCIALTLAIASPVEAQTDRDVLAKRLFLRGKQQYAAGQYEQAIASFKAAGAVRPSPILDYNAGRCYDKLDRASEAIAAYQRYLAAGGDNTHHAEIRARIAELKKKVAAPRDPYADLERPRPPASVPASQPSMTPEEPGLAAPPPPSLRSPSAQPPPHEASLAPAWGGGPNPAPVATPQPRRPPPQRPPPPQAPPRRDEGPFYKQWWFWAACAGGAAIAGFIIGIAATSHSNTGNHTSGLQVRF